MIKMNTNLTKEEAYEIAEKYIKKYNFTENTDRDIDRYVTFYESIFNIEGAAWVVTVKYPSFFPGDIDETTYVISDTTKKVEFVMDSHGIIITHHLR